MGAPADAASDNERQVAAPDTPAEPIAADDAKLDARDVAAEGTAVADAAADAPRADTAVDVPAMEVAGAGGQTRCGELCVDGQRDPQNCGLCGVFCGAGLTGAGGFCRCPEGTNNRGLGAVARCGSTDSAADHGGACGRTCAAGRRCVTGACVCPAGQTRCGAGAAATCFATRLTTVTAGLAATPPRWAPAA